MPARGLLRIVRATTLIAAAGGLIATAAGAAALTGALGERQQAVEPRPAQLPVSRRTDPSIDRYTYTRHSRLRQSEFTGAQAWLASRSSPIVAHDSDPHVSLYLTSWDDGPPVTAYVNGTGVNLSNNAGLRDARAYLLKTEGQQVRVDGWATLDMRNPDARRWWLYGSDDTASCTSNRDRRAALDLLACGYDGLWIDNMLTQPANWFTPDPRIDAREWGEALVQLMRELRDALPAGKSIVINGHWTDLDFPYADQPVIPTDEPLVRIAQLADQLVIEGGAIDSGLVYGAPVTTPWSYRRLLRYADAMHEGGVRLQWEKTSSDDLVGKDRGSLRSLPSCRDTDYRRWPAWRRGSDAWRAHVRSAAFNLASALLTYETGDGVGDMCEYPGRGWRGYGVNLGWPAGPRTDDGQLISRTFTGGAVVVNPGRRTARVRLPDGRRGVNLASTAGKPDTTPRSRFTLAGRSALVIRYR